MFTDLVGSTEIRSSLGEDAAEELRRHHDQLLADAVASHAGTVVKGLGDGIMASFPGAAEAVLGAVAIQRSVRRWCRKSATNLALRIGVSAGDVTWENGDCFGNPVVEAARLCAAAEGDQILISDVVRLLAGSRSNLVLHPVGPLDLKGLAVPVAAWDVEWVDAAGSSPLASLPPGLSSEGQFPFVARASELETALRCLKQAAGGERRAVLLAGEPGIGKTRLSAEVARRALDDGAVVLYGRCDEELGIPYQPFAEALRWTLRRLPQEELADSLGPGAADLVRLAPELSQLVPALEAPPASDPDVERARLFAAVGSWLASLSGEQPVVLVLDDLHWAGKPTLLLLRHLLRDTDPLRVLILGTYRDTDLARTHPLAELLADLRREPAVERIRVAGLDTSGVKALVEAAAGHDIDADEAALAELIHDETDGNPFFVSEVLYHLGESGAVYQTSDGRWHVRPGELSIPEGVREVVGRRVARLSEAGASVLSTAAVIGSQFGLAVLGAVSELPVEKVESGIEEALAAGLVRAVPDRKLVYRFSHALVRSTLYDEISTLRLVRLHRQVGEAIEVVHAARLEDHVVELAHHYSEAAAMGQVDKAVEYCRRAARRALDQLALDEAVTWLSRSLELVDAAGDVGPRIRCEILVELGDAMRRSGDAACREVLLDAGARADALGAADLVVAAALANNYGASYTRYGSVDTEKVAAVERALELAGEDVDRARLSIRLAGELTFSDEPNRAKRLVEDALELGRRCGLDDVVIDSVAAWMGLRGGPETLERRLALAAEAMERAERLGQERLRVFAAVNGYHPFVEAGDVTAGARTALEAVRAAEAVKEPALLWVAHMRHASLLLLGGRLADVEAAVTRIEEYGIASGRPEAEIARVAFLGTLRCLQGRSSELIDTVMAAFEGYGPSVELHVAWYLVAAGRRAEAREILDRVAEIGVERLVAPQRPWSAAAVGLAISGAGVGHTEICRAAGDMLAPYPGQFILGPPSQPMLSTDEAVAACLYACGDLVGAEQRLRAAIALYVRMQSPVWMGRAELRLADVLRCLGREREAGESEQRGSAALTAVGLEPAPLTLRDP